MSRIVYCQKQDTFFREAAHSIEKSLNRVLAERQYAVFAMCGGRSVQGICSHLLKRSIDWSRVHIFLVDERLVKPTDKDANCRLIRESFQPLFDKGIMSGANLHSFDGSAPDRNLPLYERSLRMLGGRYDLLLLSCGEDGHIGALYPHHHSIRDNADYFFTMTDSPKPPAGRMTSSRRLILRSGSAVLVFMGEGKKKALRNFLDIRQGFYSCPAKLVQDIPDSTIVTNIKA
jgi:6-phosphogluconolactonase